MIRPGSQNARLLEVLADGRWHLSRDLHERCGYMRTNSRIAELRSHGHDILGESVPGKTGTDGYRYRLLHDPAQRAEATTTPEGAKGWVDQAGSAQVLAGGHGLDVAPDASPEGVRVEARHASTTAGVSRALPPTPVQLTFEDVAA